MAKTNRKSLFIFRRDLRVEDNTGLAAALRSSEHVVPCFIFDPKQVEENPYRSDNAVQFMIESLRDLDRQLGRRGARLYLFYGRPHVVVRRLIRKEAIEAVYVNRDYTPFSRERDAAIAQACRASEAGFHQLSDLLLNEPEEVVTKAGGPYTIFTAFHKRAFPRPPRQPQRNRYRNFWTKPIAEAQGPDLYRRVLHSRNARMSARGGRPGALGILRDPSRFRDYETDKDYPARRATTGLSAHLKFGTCSIREAYHAFRDELGSGHPLLRQLYWRDFFTHVTYHFPRVLGQSFREEYDQIRWSRDEKAFEAWCDGRTGFPIVDAGMRALNVSGFMHNRVRMIAASFLTKDLHVDWRWGERYFAQKLVDYDPSVNNGNWQWAASTGCDAQPYFRIFNPWLQQRKFDPTCEYIKAWVPELIDLDAEAIHAWEKRGDADRVGYPRPIADHARESTLAKRMYAAARAKGRQ